MTTNQAVFFGIMVALTPGFLLAVLLWRDEIGLGEDKKPDLRNRYSSPDLEFDDQPP